MAAESAQTEALEALLELAEDLGAEMFRGPAFQRRGLHGNAFLARLADPAASTDPAAGSATSLLERAREWLL